MNAALGVAEKRAFEMNAERARAHAVCRSRVIDGLGERIEGTQGYINGRGDSGRAVTGYTMAGHVPLDRGEACVGAFHDVVPSATVDVDVDETWGKYGVAKIDDLGISGSGHFGALTCGDDETVLDEECGIFDSFEWRE